MTCSFQIWMHCKQKLTSTWECDDPFGFPVTCHICFWYPNKILYKSKSSKSCNLILLISTSGLTILSTTQTIDHGMPQQISGPPASICQWHHKGSDVNIHKKLHCNHRVRNKFFAIFTMILSFSIFPSNFVHGHPYHCGYLGPHFWGNHATMFQQGHLFGLHLLVGLRLVWEMGEATIIFWKELCNKIKLGHFLFGENFLLMS